MFQRLQHFFNTIRTNWSDDPAARGAAKMTAGAVLLVEGLFGVLRSGRSGRSRRRGRGGRSIGGIVGGVIGIGMGIVFIVVGNFVTPTPADDAVETTGTIVDTVSSRNSDGDMMYSPVIAFEADGEMYEFTQGMRSSSRPREGSEVTVMYSASNPQDAHRTDGVAAYLPWAFTGAGIFIILSSLVSLAISIVLIVFGVILFKQGRADRAEAGSSEGFFSDLFSLVTQAREGDVAVEETAAGQSGGAQGVATLLFGNAGSGQSAQSAAASPATSPAPPTNAEPAPPPSGPPSGWYIDPEDDTVMRWWDGQSWASQRRPREGG